MEITVARSRVAEGNFVQYELCTQRVSGRSVAWRRFNEFKQLDAALRSDPALKDLPALQSAGFFARYGITATDVEERRGHLQSYTHEVMRQVGEDSDLLRDFLALDTTAEEVPERREDSVAATAALPQPSASIEVPAAATRAGAQESPGSPYAVSPPDSYHGEEQAEVFDLASWVMLQDSDDEEDAARNELGSAASADAARSDGGAKAPADSALGTTMQPVGKPPRRSYVAAARASLLVGEPLPPEPTKLQMVSWLHRNASAEFLRENHLNGHPRAIANARSREELADTYYLALVAKVPIDKLEGLIFDTMDSDLDERVNRNELRYSPFEQTLGPAWDQIANGKPHIERSDWTRYVEAVKTKVGGAVEKFLAELVFEADVDVAHLLPQVAGHLA